MTNSIYASFQSVQKHNQKKFAVLVDPDKVTGNDLKNLIKIAVHAQVDYFFVGGSLLVNDHLNEIILQIKSSCTIPVILFPGSVMQVNPNADALFFLSLISGRNAELLIGQHVIAAPIIKANNIESISTGYMLINGGRDTTVSYMSNSIPIPSDKPEIAACTALAGEMLGLKLIYMDAGSGALEPVSEAMIKAVREQVNIPIIVGGGITTPEKAYLACMAGCDVVVVGNAVEKNPSLIAEISQAIHSAVVVS
jgi:putative glycerol-1-phosphate prenyltransferase